MRKEIPVPPPLYEPDNPIVIQEPSANVQEGKGIIENGFLRCEIDLDSLHITRLLNKYINDEILHSNSRLFVINAQGKDIPESDYELLEAKASSDENQAAINASWQSRKASFRVDLDMTIQRDSQEMLLSLEAKNLGAELLTLGITHPFIENIKIGERVEDDYYFFPMMTGWCGKLSLRIRHAYGYMAWMQLLAVFDPIVGGGVFTYTRDAEGVPKNLIVNKRNFINEDPVPHSTSLYSEHDPGNIFKRLPGTSMAVRHLLYELRPGQSCQLPQAVIGISKGDWHDGFNHYKNWVRSWFDKKCEPPRWFLNNYEYISQHPHGGAWPSAGFADTVDKDYVYSERMGPTEVGAMTEWWAWWDYPKDLFGTVSSDFDITRTMEGDYDYNIRRGGLSALREEIHAIHQKGGRVQLYVMDIGCSDESCIGREHGAEWGRKNSKGAFTKDWVDPSHSGYNACCYVEGWQKHLSDRMATVLQETGADSYRLDVSAALYPCYNPDHSHYDGTVRSAVSPKKMGQFLELCSRKGRKANPKAALMTEHAGNEYLAQFIDGYLTQLFRKDTPFFADFQGMNAYNLVFMRFLLPEIKVIIFGYDPEDAGKRAFFNAVGQDRGGARGKTLRYITRTHRVLIENGDAVKTLNPRPLIPTRQEGLLANAFPGENKRLWTLWNRNSNIVDGDLLAVDAKKNVHYVEMLHDVPILANSKNNQTIISGKIEPQEVISICELPKILNAEIVDETLEINVDGQQSGMRVEFFIGEDKQAEASNLPLKTGKGQASLASQGKVIVKLFQGKYLLDEVVLRSE